MNDFTVTPVAADDRAAWQPLFEGYAAFYQVRLAADTADTVWHWLLDEAYPLEGLIARDADGRAVGLAHVRACPRSLGGGEIGFLDDLFVEPAARGSGAADALFAALAERADARGWPAIRWLTQHFNARGRAFYDRYTAGPSDFIMYHWTPSF